MNISLIVACADHLLCSWHSSRCFGRYKMDKRCSSCLQPWHAPEPWGQHKAANQDLLGLLQKNCRQSVEETEMSKGCCAAWHCGRGMHWVALLKGRMGKLKGLMCKETEKDLKSWIQPFSNNVLCLLHSLSNSAQVNPFLNARNSSLILANAADASFHQWFLSMKKAHLHYISILLCQKSRVSFLKWDKPSLGDTANWLSDFGQIVYPLLFEQDLRSFDC